jgi:hypothetical protein
MPLSEDFRGREIDTTAWQTLGAVQPSKRGLVFEGNSDAVEVPYLISKRQFDPTLGPVTIVCDVRFPRLTSTDVPSFSILTRSDSDRTAMDRAWRDVVATCVRCNFRSATDEFDGLLELSTKYERDRELTSLSWRGFRRPQEAALYRLVMRDDGVNVSFTVTEVENPSVTKTVTCRSLFQGYENHIALEGWNRGSVIVEKLQVFQQRAADRPAEHFNRFAFATQNHTRFSIQKSSNPLRTLLPDGAALIIEDRFEEPDLNETIWSALGDVEIVEGKAALGPSNADNHIDTFHPRPYLLSHQRFSPKTDRVFALGKIEFDENYLQGYGGSFAVMSRCEGKYGKGPEWAVSALSTGIRCNLWPAAPSVDHNLEIHEKTAADTLTFLKGGTLAINPRSRGYYFLMEDSGSEATITFQDISDPAISGTIRHQTSPNAPDSGVIAFESTWGSRVLLDDVQIFVSGSASHEKQP